MPWNEVMHKWKAGTLKSGGSGKTVSSRKQAIAIMLSEKRKAASNPEYRPTGRGGTKPSNGLKEVEEPKPAQPDQTLWQECQAVIPKQRPDKLPAFLGTVDNGEVKVFMVDGDLVRVHHDMDFISGGNGCEDPKLCKENEIVLDSETSLWDLAYDCYHEAVERRVMKKGMSYARAHQLANSQERELRIANRTGARTANSQAMNAPGPQPTPQQ